MQSKLTSGVIRHCSNTGFPCSHNAGNPGLHWKDELQMIPPEVKHHINHIITFFFFAFFFFKHIRTLCGRQEIS